MHSSTMKGFDPLVPYLISNIELLLLLKREYHFSLNLGTKVFDAVLKMKQDMSHEFLLFCMLLPSSVGGLPIMSPLELVHRGHPDPVTSELVWLKHLGDRGCVTAKVIMIWITKRQGIHNKKNYKMLNQDTLALNWSRPQQAVNIIKETLESTLSEKAPNKDIKLLLRTYDKNGYDKMVDYLMTIKPCVPRVSNEILRNSPEGTKFNFLSTFIDMRTMKGVLMYEETCSLLESLKQSDLDQIIFMVMRFKTIQGCTFLSSFKQSYNSPELTKEVNNDWICTSRLADNLGELSWGIEINGSTTPHPIEQVSLCLSSSDNCFSCDGHKEYITYLLLDPPIPQIMMLIPYLFGGEGARPLLGIWNCTEKDQPIHKNIRDR